LLPNKYVPNEFEIGEELIVFVYLDHEERQFTTLEPYILMSLLRVNYVNQVVLYGLGYGKIFSTVQEQARPMEKANAI
jgi:predicted RNA-binding protein (virulence factor B family)